MLSDKVFDLQPGVRASFGTGSLAKLPRRVRALGEPRVLIVTDAGVVAAGIATKVRAVLEADGIDVDLFARVRSNPRVECVEDGSDHLRRDPDRVVVALGGGSSLDAGKAIALVGANRGHAAEFPVGCKPAQPGRPVIAIPTTAGSGSETNMFGVVTDWRLGRKIVIGHPSVLPAACILDAELSTTLPPRITAVSGMDALSHALEAFVASRANPYSDALALRATAAIATHLPRAVERGNDPEARAEMLLGAHLAGLSFASSGLGLGHAMAHAFGARLDVPHGQALATVMPHVMRFNLPVCELKYAQLAIALGALDPERSTRDNAERAIEAVAALAERIGTAVSARELGLEMSLIPTLLDDTMADTTLSGTPRFPQPEDVQRLWEGTLAP
jgi:alcohol dehydrogenase